MEKIVKEVSLIKTTGKTTNGDIVFIPDISVSYNFKVLLKNKVYDLGVFDDVVTGVTAVTTTTPEPVSTTSTIEPPSTTEEPSTTTTTTTTTTVEPSTTSTTTTEEPKQPVTIELNNVSPQLGKWRVTFNGVSAGVLELEGDGSTELTLALVAENVNVVVEKIEPNTLTQQTTEISFIRNNSFPIEKVESLNPSVDTSITPSTHTFTNVSVNDRLTVKIDLLT